MFQNDVVVKEEFGSEGTHAEEILRKLSDPFEDLETCIGLEHEKRNGLLEDEADNNLKCR